MEQSLGLIKWFDNEKGFGIIVTTNGNEVFIHSKDFVIKPVKVLKAKALFFDILDGKKGKKATNVINPETFEHFIAIMNLMDTDPKVMIEVIIIGESRWGNKFKKNEYRSHSIFDYALKQIIKNIDRETIKSFFINYFDDNVWNSGEKLKKIFHITGLIINNLKINSQLTNIEDTTLSPIPSNSMLLEIIFKHYLSNINDDFLFELWKKDVYPLDKTNYFSLTQYYELPYTIFLSNLEKINYVDISKILNTIKNEEFCFEIILNQIKNYNIIGKSEASKIVDCINILLDYEKIKTLYDIFINRNIELIKQSEKINNDDDNFKLFLEIITTYNWKFPKADVIEIINSKLSSEQILKYWKETRYFAPTNAFILENIDKISRNDFLNTSIEFHEIFLVSEFKKSNYDNSLRSFCNLIFLACEMSKSSLQCIQNELDEKYKVAIWLYPSILFKHKLNNVNPRSRIDFLKDDFINYLIEIDTLDETIRLIKIINAIQKKFKDHLATKNADDWFIMNLDDRRRSVDEICNQKEFSLEVTELDILEFCLKIYSKENINRITECFFPKFINPEEDLIFKEILSLNPLLENLMENKLYFYSHISKFTSIPKLVFLWYKEYINSIDLNISIDYLKRSPDDIQFVYLKRIFSSLHLNNKLVTPELFSQFEDLSNSPYLNLDVKIALYVVNSLKKNNQFINDKTIFELVSQRLNENVNELLKIDNLVDKCKGKTWRALKFDEKKKETWSVSINGHNFFVKDDAISINYTSYPLNKENKSVCINGIYYNFKWVKDNNNCNIKNYGVPEGVTFCDAIKSQFDETLNMNFFWCCNSKCYNPCQKDYNPFQWESYTLRDFIKILKIPFNDNLYYRFVSVINRVNRLLEKLKCKSCNKLMRDAKTSEFAFYRVNTFHCTDFNCSEYHKSVYLTHCLNWKCLNVIDSRISKTCTNGWYICDKCDNCCSQEKIDSRYKNLLTNAAFNPNNPRHQKLKFQVDNKLGHLEKEEIYDFRTGTQK